MIARCANPDCNCQFRELGKGRLFLLPPVRELREAFSSEPRLIDHCYWLCPACSLTYTMCLEDSKPVVRRIEPELARAAVA